MRKCPHGVSVGPLDDYGVPESERVFSTYCDECDREQRGDPPPPLQHKVRRLSRRCRALANRLQGHTT